MTKQTFIRGTIVLIIAGMVTRLLGFVNRIVIARLMGEEGVGLYMMALPTLFLMITLTQIGLPIAISKQIAEANARNDKYKIQQIISISFLIITCTSILFTIGLLFIIPLIAHYFLTDERTLYPLLMISPIVPIIAFTSVIKGYFQGMQNMKPQSYAIVIEQIIRIASVFILVKLAYPFGVEYAAAAAMISVFIGELASLLFLIYTFKTKKNFKSRYRLLNFIKSSQKTMNELFTIALPNTGSKLISAFSSFLEPILVAQSLALAGVATIEATKQYGELTGYAMPLLFLPTFITNSLSIALVPSISEFAANNETSSIHNRIHQAIRISFASGALATIIFTLFSTPILTYMYQTSNASKFIILMAPFFLFLYIQAPLQATLFGLGLAKQAMWNSLIGSIIKFIVLFFLTSHPQFGIMGVAIAICTSVVLITFLHLITLYKAIQFSLQHHDLFKMICLIIFTCIFGYIGKFIFDHYTQHLGLLLAIIFILTIIYLLLLFLFKFITEDELKQIPFLNKFI